MTRTTDWPHSLRLLACSLVWVGMSTAVAQTLPEAFDPIGTAQDEPPPQGWLLALPRGVVQQWVAGASSVALGRGARASFVPVGWLRREERQSGSVWILQVQTDGFKRITSALPERNGLADVTVSSTWERALDERLKGRAALGVILPSHGEVGGKKEAALLSVGLVHSLAGIASQVGGTLSVLQGAPPGRPGGSRTVLRADVQWRVSWGPALKTTLSGTRTHQDAATQLQELALAAVLVLQPGTELRARVWEQRIDGAPQRRGIGVAVARLI